MNYLIRLWTVLLVEEGERKGYDLVIENLLSELSVATSREKNGVKNDLALEGWA